MSNSLSLYMSASCTLISSKLQKVETFCFVVGTSSDRVVMEFLLRFKMIETQRGHRLSQTQYNCSSKKEFLLMSMVLFVAVHNHYKRIYMPIRRLGARPRRCRRRRVLGPCFHQETLNMFSGMGRSVWKEACATLQNILSAVEPVLPDNKALRNKCLVPMSDIEMVQPIIVGGYTDFFCSVRDGRNCGFIFCRFVHFSERSSH